MSLIHTRELGLSAIYRTQDSFQVDSCKQSKAIQVNNEVDVLDLMWVDSMPDPIQGAAFVVSPSVLIYGL